MRDLHKAYGALKLLMGVDMVARKGQILSPTGSQGEPVCCKGPGHARHPGDAKQRWGGPGARPPRR